MAARAERLILRDLIQTDANELLQEELRQIRNTVQEVETRLAVRDNEVLRLRAIIDNGQDEALDLQGITIHEEDIDEQLKAAENGAFNALENAIERWNGASKAPASDMTMPLNATLRRAGQTLSGRSRSFLGVTRRLQQFHWSRLAAYRRLTTRLTLAKEIAQRTVDHTIELLSNMVTADATIANYPGMPYVVLNMIGDATQDLREMRETITNEVGEAPSESNNNIPTTVEAINAFTAELKLVSALHIQLKAARDEKDQELTAAEERNEALQADLDKYGEADAGFPRSDVGKTVISDKVVTELAKLTQELADAETEIARSAAVISSILNIFAEHIRSIYPTHDIETGWTRNDQLRNHLEDFQTRLLGEGVNIVEVQNAYNQLREEAKKVEQHFKARINVLKNKVAAYRQKKVYEPNSREASDTDSSSDSDNDNDNTGSVPLSPSNPQPSRHNLSEESASNSRRQLEADLARQEQDNVRRQQQIDKLEAAATTTAARIISLEDAIRARDELLATRSSSSAGGEREEAIVELSIDLATQEQENVIQQQQINALQATAQEQATQLAAANSIIQTHLQTIAAQIAIIAARDATLTHQTATIVALNTQITAQACVIAITDNAANAPTSFFASASNMEPAPSAQIPPQASQAPLQAPLSPPAPAQAPLPVVPQAATVQAPAAPPAARKPRTGGKRKPAAAADPAVGTRKSKRLRGEAA